MNLRDRGTFPAMLKGTVIRLKASSLPLYLLSLIVFTACAPRLPPEGYDPFDEPPFPVGGTAAIIQNISGEARELSINGTVVLSAFINTKGEVTELFIIKPDPTMNMPVANAIMRTPWKPAKLMGEAVGAWVNIPVEIQSGEATVRYPLYDHPPMPIGGYAAFRVQLRRRYYPPIAIDAGVKGTVIVQAYVSTEGEVTSVMIQRSIPNTGLDEGAMEAIKNTTFTPAMLNGEAVGTWIAIPVYFGIQY